MMIDYLNCSERIHCHNEILGPGHFEFGLISLDERLLSNVFRFRRVTHVTQYQLHHLVLVLAHQQVERTLVTALHAFDENQITFFRRHRSTLAPCDLNRP